MTTQSTHPTRRRPLRIAGAVVAAAAVMTLQACTDDSGGGSSSAEDAMAEAAAELEAIDRYADAAALRPAAMTPTLTLGLWGQTPEVDLTAARDALAQGDLESSIASSTAAAETPRREETRAPSRSSCVQSRPRSPRLDRLWWICRARVLFPEPIVP